MWSGTLGNSGVLWFLIVRLQVLAEGREASVKSSAEEILFEYTTAGLSFVTLACSFTVARTFTTLVFSSLGGWLWSVTETMSSIPRSVRTEPRRPDVRLVQIQKIEDFEVDFLV